MAMLNNQMVYTANKWNICIGIKTNQATNIGYEGPAVGKKMI